MNKRMNKRIVTMIVAVLFIAVIAPVSAFAAWNWVSKTKVDNNTVTVDTPVYVAIGGETMSGTVKPGLEGSDTVSATFNIDVNNAGEGVTYALKITGIQDNELGLGGWQYAVGEGNFTALSEGAILAEIASTGSITLKIKATEELAEAWAGQSLTFAVELVQNV